MSSTNYKLLIEKFGYRAAFKVLRYSLWNKLGFYKELQGMTVTMETLDPSYLEGPESYEYRFLAENELREMAKDGTQGISDSFLDRVLPKGDTCFAIIDGDKVVSYGWYSDQPTHITPQLVLYFDKSWIYMYKGYTMNEYRGQRLHAIGMARALQAFTQKGYKGIISYVETSNFPSLRSCDRMGYKNFGRVKIKKITGDFSIKTQSACGPFGFTVKLAGRD